jgi:hypothetical protein
MTKRFNYKIYSSTGQYITTWLDVVEDPAFQMVINGGAVQMLIKLARKTQDFGEESDVAFGNEVQVWCFDTDAPAGVKIFAGYISRYDPSNDGPQEIVDVYCLGYHTTLKDYIHENDQGNTNPIYTNEDATKIAEYAINNARRLGCPVNWNETTLQKTGQMASYNFQINTVQEVMDKILELTPDRWYWYVDPDKNLNWHPKADNAIHTFTIGKEIYYIQAQKRTEAVCNRLYYVGGVASDGSTNGSALYSRYDRPASIAQYGLKAQKKTDSRIKDQATLDLIANNALDLLQDPEIRTIIRIKDNNYDPVNGYDIEKIKVGDTCQIRNYQDISSSSKWDVMKWDLSFWDFNVRNITETIMQIMQINYTPDYVELTISSKLPDVVKTSRLIAKDLIDYIVKDVPSAPTMGPQI